MTDEKVKRPASQYYWGDWFKDLALQSCSLQARGLWHEMNCLQHQGEPYGHLTMPNGKTMSPAQLANLCKIQPTLCKRLIAELEDAGVLSRTAEGVIFSRRMVRDERVREARAAGGKAGAEHGIKGAEHGAKGGRPAMQEGGSETPLTGDLKPPPSSSSSSASSPSGISSRESSGTSPSPAGEGTAAPPFGTMDLEPDTAIPPCDHQAVLALWSQLLPAHPQPKKWTDTRRKHLQARWRELFAEGKAKTRDEALAWFARYFRWIGQSRFLTGRSKPTGDRPPFIAQLDWTLLPDHLANVIEGKYHPED